MASSTVRLYRVLSSFAPLTSSSSCVTSSLASTSTSSAASSMSMIPSINPITIATNSTGVRWSSTSGGVTSQRVLEEKNLNPNLLKAEYAVRGELVLKSLDLAAQLAKGANLPFKEIISCNIGNPQDLGQQPITFFRQVLSLCHYPALMSDPASRGAFPEDAIARAKKYLASAKKGGTGAYTHSKGLPAVREEVAAFIQQRDGFPTDPEDIFLSDGASSAIKSVLTAVIRNEKDGIMVPIPQYPLYSASIALLGGSLAGYELDESKGWGLTEAQLTATVNNARAKGINVRSLVVINPGNPTGQCLPAENIKQIIQFCKRERIVILADEVYQANIYASTPFTSFKKVLRSLGPEYRDFELFSFHSTSKGFLGECGQRGGYMECTGIAGPVKDQLYKMASISLCSNTSGQIMTGLMVNPPKQGEPSYAKYAAERDGTLASLKRRAVSLAKTLNSIPGVKCNPVEGAMYAFPSIELPAKAIAAAKAAGKAPDTFYCLALLQATGIVVVPGSGFGQKAGTWHFRTTILPPEEQMAEMLSRFATFHKSFVAQYQ